MEGFDYQAELSHARHDDSNDDGDHNDSTNDANKYDPPSAAAIGRDGERGRESDAGARIRVLIGVDAYLLAVVRGLLDVD